MIRFLMNLLPKSSTSCRECKGTDYLYTLSRCKHSVCRKCLYEYIIKNLKPKLKCPVASCQNIISDPNLREFLSEYQEISYDKLCTAPFTRKCQTKFCGYLFPNTVGDDKSIIVQCEDCDQPNCFECGFRHLPNEEHGLGTNEKINDEDALKKLKSTKKEKLSTLEMNTLLLPALTAFQCDVCVGYILPKEGWSLRCGHQFCRSCLSSMFDNPGYKWECPNCEEHLKDCEKKALISEKKLEMCHIYKLTNKGVLFTCKGIDCGYPHKLKKGNNEFTCTKCGASNCVKHNCTHPGLTCQQYEKTKNYQCEEALMKESKHIPCYNCGEKLFKKDGCNSLQCKLCKNYTCLFKGLKTGIGGCECTSVKTCHKDCKFGCFDES